MAAASGGSGVTDEEIEVVAEELAKAGGVSWYPGRTLVAFLRPVSERYRDRARLAIAALDRLRAVNGPSDLQEPALEALGVERAVCGAPGRHSAGRNRGIPPAGRPAGHHLPRRARRGGARLSGAAHGRMLAGCPWTTLCHSRPRRRRKTRSDRIRGIFTFAPKALADSVPSEWVVNPEMRCFFHLVNDHEEIVDNTGIEVHDFGERQRSGPARHHRVAA